MFRKKDKNTEQYQPTLADMTAFKGVNYIVVGTSGDKAGTTRDHRIMVDHLIGKGYTLIAVGWGPQFYLSYPKENTKA